MSHSRVMVTVNLTVFCNESACFVVNCPFSPHWLLSQLLLLVDDVGRVARDGQSSHTCIYGVQA